MRIGTFHPDFQHRIAGVGIPWSCVVYDTVTTPHNERMKYGQRATDYARSPTELDTGSQRTFLTQATVNFILIWLLWKGLMLLLFFFSMLLIVDIAVNTVAPKDDSCKRLIRAVRLAELYLIRLIMAILTEIVNNIRLLLMSCTCSPKVQDLLHGTSGLGIKISGLEAH